MVHLFMVYKFIYIYKQKNIPTDQYYDFLFN